jgi:probable F420-dependent oxidoreductase
MEFGWDIPNVNHGFGLDNYAVGERYSAGVAVGVDTFNQVTARAQAIQFHSLWVADHLVFPDSSEVPHPLGYRPNSGRETDDAQHNVRSEDPIFEAITMMSYLVSRTTTMRIGVGALVIPYRNPVLVAKMLATLDVLSGGRIILTAGVGWLKEAFIALEADYDRRGEVTNEYIDVMRMLWREESPAFDGQHYTVPSGLRFNPKPVQKNGIPVWVGGVSGPALRRAATRGDGWLGVYQSVDDTALMHERIRGLLGAAERPVEDFTFAHRLRFQLTDQPSGDQPCIGTAKSIAEAVHRFHDVGVQHLVFAPPPGPTTEYLLEQVDRFEDEVKPRINDLWD